MLFFSLLNVLQVKPSFKYKLVQTQQWVILLLIIGGLLSIIIKLLLLFLYLPTLYINILFMEQARGVTSTFLFSKNFYIMYIQSNLFGSSLLILCYVISFISIKVFGERQFLTKSNSSILFLYFIIWSTFLTNTLNLLTIFLSFEFLFLPTIYFVYVFGYAQRVDKTIFILVLWTFFGSFLVGSACLYLYANYHTLDYVILMHRTFSWWEKVGLYLTFFLGLGIKIPLFPFYFWLTKVHVEAPAGFSIFLSGFLVKTAFFFFYFVNLLFATPFLQHVFIVWVSFGVFEVSLKLWNQIDLKKLIAYATVQEMNLLLLATLLISWVNIYLITSFLLLHGVLSALMFYIVELIQIRTQTRNIFLLSGFGSKCIHLRFITWIMLLFYLGLPCTVKFLIEWCIGCALIQAWSFFGFFIFFMIVTIGNLGFMKVWLILLSGSPSQFVQELKITDLNKNELVLVFLLVSLLVLITGVFICF